MNPFRKSLPKWRPYNFFLIPKKKWRQSLSVLKMSRTHRSQKWPNNFIADLVGNSGFHCLIVATSTNSDLHCVLFSSSAGSLRTAWPLLWIMVVGCQNEIIFEKGPSKVHISYAKVALLWTCFHIFMFSGFMSYMCRNYVIYHRVTARIDVSACTTLSACIYVFIHYISK